MVYRVRAFTEEINGGNPAGVVLEADQLHREQMLKIAKEVNYSETAFISKSRKADFKIRYFTPSDEVDLCGHATIAAFTVLIHEKIVKSGMYTIETLAGILPVEVKSDGSVYLTQLCPSFYEYVDKKLIAKSLGISSENILHDPQVVSTGLKDIMIQLDTSRTLSELKPNFQLITQVSELHESTGYHVFTLDSDKTARCRNFAPLYAIDEESATGTASGAVSGYIIHHQLIPHCIGVNTVEYEQGIEMKAPSLIKGYITMNPEGFESVVIGGKGIIM